MLTRNDLNRMRNQFFGAVIIALTLPIASAAQAERISVSRGTINIGSNDAWILSRDEYCGAVIDDWGWSSCEHIDAMVAQNIPQVDTMWIEVPNNEGYVRFDDWDTNERDDAIKSIERQLKASVKAQGDRLGEKITFDGWRVYPTLNKEKGILYYATDLDWAGKKVTNIEAAVFDRYGYVTFNFVPVSNTLGTAEVEALILKSVEAYTPKAEVNYASFVTGDAVAAGGAIGVLAVLTGTKWGKSAAAGAMAIALMFLKKAWFLLLLPFAWLGSLFSRKKA